MSIPAISALSGVSAASTLGSTTQVTGATGTSGSSFANVLGSSVDTLQGLQSTADSLAVQAVTGNLSDVHQYTIAATEAKLAVQLTAAIRDKAVGAFTEIMRMQA
jgi:flagellar hook-basal body complex protein FliE